MANKMTSFLSRPGTSPPLLPFIHVLVLDGDKEEEGEDERFEDEEEGKEEVSDDLFETTKILEM